MIYNPGFSDSQIRDYRLVLLLMVLIFSEAINAEEYFLATYGSDSAGGSFQNPWGSLRKANNELRPGDTLTILPGHYVGSIYPKRSGEAGRPIIYRASEAGAVILRGPRTKRTTSAAISIVGVEHIEVQGFRIEPDTLFGRWVSVRNSAVVRLSSLYMKGCRYKTPFKIEKSRDVILRDSVLTEHYGSEKDIGNMAVVSHSTGIVMEGNVFSKASHSPLQFHPPGSNSNVVIRANMFNAGWGRNFEIFSVKNILLENNVITNAYNGARSADTQAKFIASNGIFRFNRIVENNGIPLSINPYHKSHVVEHIRLYNNHFSHNVGSGLLLSGDVDAVRDVVVQNNVFWRNDYYGGGNQLRISNGLKRDILFVSNNIASGQEANGEAIWFRGVARSKEVLNVSEAQAKYPEKFYNNTEVNVNEPSALGDLGSPLTRAAADGEGIELPVLDVFPFYDGFGLSGELGDFIQIGDRKKRARILKVDRESGVLTLDRAVKWQKSDPVSLPWIGRRPSIGLSEVGLFYAGEDNFIEGSFIRSPATTLLDEEFIVSTESELLDTALIDIRTLSDGSSSIDEREENAWKLAFSSPGRQSFHTKISLPHGKPFYVLTYIDVIERNSSSTLNETGKTINEKQTKASHTNASHLDKKGRFQLVETDFDHEGGDWWWMWQVYRPGPAAYQIESRNGQQQDNCLRVYAPADKGRLPARIYPSDWDAQAYPILHLDYRIQPDTSIEMILLGHEKSSGPRRLTIARVASVGVDPLAGVDSFELLKNDGEWHSLEVDVRNYFGSDPAFRWLKGFAIEAVDKQKVKIGQGYWMDNFSISTHPTP